LVEGRDILGGSPLEVGRDEVGKTSFSENKCFLYKI